MHPHELVSHTCKLLQAQLRNVWTGESCPIPCQPIPKRRAVHLTGGPQVTGDEPGQAGDVRLTGVRGPEMRGVASGVSKVNQRIHGLPRFRAPAQGPVRKGSPSSAHMSNSPVTAMTVMHAYQDWCSPRTLTAVHACTRPIGLFVDEPVWLFNNVPRTRSMAATRTGSSSQVTSSLVAHACGTVATPPPHKRRSLRR